MESPEPASGTSRHLSNDKIALIMVGLPARGKSFIARNLARYLRWTGVKTSVISLAILRKTMIGDKLKADFFNPENENGAKMRREIADKALNQLIRDFEIGTQICIMDASNTNAARREYINQVLTGLNIKVLFLECVYEDEVDLVESHVRELRMTFPDYEDLTDSEAITDFKSRIQYYKPDYTTMAEGNQSLSYIQIFNGGQRIVVNQLRGFLRTRTLYYLMNLRPSGRKSIFLMQSSAVEQDTSILNAFRLRFDIPVWVDTKIDIDAKDFRQRATLCKLIEGDCEGLTQEQIKERYPEEYKQHCLKPYHHRYHMAESYHDLVVRLESIIMELEKSSGSILIIADVSVIRCIYAYFIGAYPFVIPSISFGDDPREIIKLEPKAYGCYETRIPPDQLDCVHSLPANFRQYVDLS